MSEPRAKSRQQVYADRQQKRANPTIPSPGPNTPGRKVMERRLADKSDKSYQGFETLSNRTATGYGPDGKGIIPHNGVSRAYGPAAEALGNVISKRAEWTAKAEAEKPVAKPTPTPKSQGARAVDAAIGGATIGSLAYDAGNAAGAVTGTARNAQIAGDVGAKLAKRGADGLSRLGISAAASKVAGSPFATVAGRAINSPLMSGLSRVALPILAIRAAYNAYEGYKKDGVKGALLGAADAATFGLASVGAHKAGSMYQAAMHGNGDPTTMALAKAAGHGMFGSPALAAPAPKQPAGGAPRLDASKAREFAAANMAFVQSQARSPSAAAPDQPGGGGPRGFANPAVQKAAQDARGVQNFSDWAKDAEPGKGKKQ